MVHHLATIHEGWRTNEWIQNLHERFCRFDTIVYETVPHNGNGLCDHDRSLLLNALNRISAGDLKEFRRVEALKREDASLLREQDITGEHAALNEFFLSFVRALYKCGARIEFEDGLYDPKSYKTIANAYAKATRVLPPLPQYPLGMDLDAARKARLESASLLSYVALQRDNVLSRLDDSAAILLGAYHHIAGPEKTILLDIPPVDHVSPHHAEDHINALLAFDLCAIPFYKEHDEKTPRNISTSALYDLLRKVEGAGLEGAWGQISEQRNAFRRTLLPEKNTVVTMNIPLEYVKTCKRALDALTARYGNHAVLPDLSKDYQDFIKPYCMKK